MAWRLDKAIIRGELDNTEQGRLQLRLEIVGYHEPICLDLVGDAWRDVAGSRISFVNPDPEPQSPLLPFFALQTGVVGDVTASRKVKVFTVPEEEWLEAYEQKRIQDVPTEWRNSLYIEWFTAGHGRCVIESADFEMVVNEHSWEMDEDEEAAQKMANMHAMREYLAGIIQRKEYSEEDDDDEEDESFSEEAWEEQLKASDRLTDANMEAADKYEEDEDSEEKIAFVMGWDHMIEDMADEQEGVLPSEDDSEEKKRRREWVDAMNEAAEEALANMEDFEEEEKEDHPLSLRAREFVMRVMDEMKEAGIEDDRGISADNPLDRFLSNCMNIMGKISGALSYRRGNLSEMESGYVLAISKRCLNWANEALSATQDLMEHPDYTAHHELIEGWRTELFGLREGLTDLRQKLRQDRSEG
jgi:hypothetical protein